MKAHKELPLDCPHCSDRARRMVSLGNYWVGCIYNKHCEGSKHLGISRREFYAVKEWNGYVRKLATPSARGEG